MTLVSQVPENNVLTSWIRSIMKRDAGVKPSKDYGVTWKVSSRVHLGVIARYAHALLD